MELLPFKSTLWVKHDWNLNTSGESVLKQKRGMIEESGMNLESQFFWNYVDCRYRSIQTLLTKWKPKLSVKNQNCWTMYSIYYNRWLLWKKEYLNWGTLYFLIFNNPQFSFVLWKSAFYIAKTIKNTKIKQLQLSISMINKKIELA